MRSTDVGTEARERQEEARRKGIKWRMREGKEQRRGKEEEAGAEGREGTGIWIWAWSFPHVLC